MASNMGQCHNPLAGNSGGGRWSPEGDIEATDVNWPAWRERKSWGRSQVLIRTPCHVRTPALGPFIESDIVQLYG